MKENKLQEDSNTKSGKTKKVNKELGSKDNIEDIVSKSTNDDKYKIEFFTPLKNIIIKQTVAEAIIEEKKKNPICMHNMPCIIKTVV
jgi:hypothetical protein